MRRTIAVPLSIFGGSLPGHEPSVGSFYETPKEDKEKEELKRQVEELTTRLDAKENGAGSMDEQVALMEKSYELAAKYMNGGQPEQVVPITPSAPVQSKGNATPVKSVSDRTVSGLQQPMSNSEFIAEYGKPRNYGFNTAVGSIRWERTLSGRVFITTKHLWTGRPLSSGC